jgi:hypothetical protein
MVQITIRRQGRRNEQSVALPATDARRQVATAAKFVRYADEIVVSEAFENYRRATHVVGGNFHKGLFVPPGGISINSERR